MSCITIFDAKIWIQWNFWPRNRRIWHDLTIYPIKKVKWSFPEMGVTPKSSILIGFFHYKPSILGYLHLWNPPNETVFSSWFSYPTAQFFCADLCGHPGLKRKEDTAWPLKACFMGVFLALGVWLTHDAWVMFSLGHFTTPVGWWFNFGRNIWRTNL